MSGLALAAHQFRFDQKTFWRNPASVFFTVMFPVMFLVIFDLVVRGNDRSTSRRGRRHHLLRPGDHHAGGRLGDLPEPGDVADDRSRVRDPEAGPRDAAPRAGSSFAGRIGNSLVVSVADARAARRASAGSLYGVPRFPGTALPAVLVTLAVGAAAFCCLGLALTGVDPLARARRRRSPTWRSSRSTSSPASSSRRARSRAGCCTSPTRSRSATSSRRSSPPGTPPPRESGFEWGHLAVVAAWGPPGCALDLQLDPYGRFSSGLRCGSLTGRVSADRGLSGLHASSVRGH